MSKENAKFHEEDKKKLEKKKKIDKKKEEEARLTFEKQKEEIKTSENTEIELTELKELLGEGIIDADIAEKIEDGESLSKSEIKEMFDKIEEIEGLKNIDKYLPKELRVGEKEYLKAIKDKKERKKAIQKLTQALQYIARQINPNSIIGINLFSGFLNILDKNLIIVQENTIDLKGSLEKINL